MLIQVLTNRDVFEEISKFTYELTLDYLACGLDPQNYKTYIYTHSHIPELNQLSIPFLTLVLPESNNITQQILQMKLATKGQENLSSYRNVG